MVALWVNYFVCRTDIVSIADFDNLIKFAANYRNHDYERTD